MDKKHITADLNIVHIARDTFIIFICYSVTCFTYFLLGYKNMFFGNLWMFLIFTVIFTLSMNSLQMYNITTFYYINRVIKNTLQSAFLASFCIGSVIFICDFKNPDILFFAIYAILQIAILTLVSVVMRIFKVKLFQKNITRTIFVGSPKALKLYNGYIQKTDMTVEIEAHIELDDPALANLYSFSDLLRSKPADEVVFFCSPNAITEKTYFLLRICEEIGVTSKLIFDVPNLAFSKRFISNVGPYPVVTYHSVSYQKLQLFFKSLMDAVGAIIALVLASPIMLVTAICIKLESPGPVLFKQVRVGKNGKHFTIYKFRSMSMDAEARKKDLLSQNKLNDGLMFKMDDDPRVTKVGAFIRKTSIDELPQLFNVLKGDMSLVGTRPPTTDEVKKYRIDHFRRISIMPGITGLWQVSGRSDIVDFDDVVALDKKYIDEWSLWLDLVIILRTFKVLVFRKGAY